MDAIPAEWIQPILALIAISIFTSAISLTLAMAVYAYVGRPVRGFLICAFLVGGLAAGKLLPALAAARPFFTAEAWGVFAGIAVVAIFSVGDGFYRLISWAKNVYVRWRKAHA